MRVITGNPGYHHLVYLNRVNSLNEMINGANAVPVRVQMEG